VTESMIERVAEVMCTAAHYDEEGEAARDWNSNQAIYREMARAAIEAMRVPTPAMQQVVSANWGRRTWSDYSDVIDAALEEK